MGKVKTIFGKLFKKKEESLEAPKNLPDLAKDIYEKSDTSKSTTAMSMLEKEFYEKKLNALKGTTLPEMSAEAKAEIEKEKIEEKAIQPIETIHLFRAVKEPSAIPVTAPRITPLAIQTTPEIPEPKPEHIPEPQPIPQPQIIQAQQQIQQPIIYSDSFFSSFENFLKQKDMDHALIEDLIEKDLLHKMKQYHVHKKTGKPFFLHTQDLNNALYNKLAELKSLESEWMIKHNELEKFEKNVVEKEEEIEQKLEELKQILREIKMHSKMEKQIPPENYFVLCNGKKLKNILELKTELKNMPDDVFYCHVNGAKNDFSSWIKDIFRNPELANRIYGLRNKEEMLKFFNNM